MVSIHPLPFPSRSGPSGSPGLRLALIFATAFSLLTARGEFSGDWPRWRGPKDNGSTEEPGAFPTRWSPTDGLAWKTELPGKGCSTPIVVGSQILLTAPVNGEDALLGFDTDGKKAWQRVFGPELAGKHRNGSGCNSSPATDGRQVFVYFKSGHLAALGLDGTIQWQTNLTARFGKDTLYWDYGTSPVLTADSVVVARMHSGGSWIAAFDKASGALRWKVSRDYETPVECDHSYASPLVIREAGAEAILVWGAQHLTAHAANDGRMLWSAGDFNPGGERNWVAVSSALVSGDLAIVPYGRGARLHGIQLGGRGDVTASHRTWKREDTGTFVPTPAEYRGRVYLVRDRGEVECLDPKTGVSHWKDALPKASGNYYSSPAIADGKIYAAREDGVVFVAAIEGKFGVLAEIPMGEPIIASPVPVARRLLLRGEKHLFCVAPPAAADGN